MTVLACAMPDHTFITSQFGEISFVDDRIPEPKGSKEPKK